MDRPLTRNIRPGQPPPDLSRYRKAGGYQALERALRSMTPAEVAGAVEASGLRGRGGAGFLTGLKWSFVPTGSDAPRPAYFVVNADEMEPGTFKDRFLMEGDPHQLVEGTILSSYAIGAEVAYIFLRWEYRRAHQLLARAIAEAREAGYLGRDIRGSGYDLELHLHVSAGRYMCGEETGLLNALEGRRATPRAKPPYPQASGLWGKPTVVNNVETVCCVPHIVDHGPAWFRSLGRGGAGTKLYGVSGKVRRPGIWELPLGVTLGELLEEHAGGMWPGHRFRGALPGGASTSFLTDDHLDVPLDFDQVEKVGSRLGTGTAVVLDDRTCPVGMLVSLEVFFSRESCGFCTPCREGLSWVARTLQAFEIGEGRAGDLEVLALHVDRLGPLGHTFCALAPGAAAPLQGALHHFAGDFERHVREQRCPWREEP
jgi:NADH-quinone oxidoreductase subunit F